VGSTISPSKLAERWGCKVDKVHTVIRSGELYAFNIATNPHGRPRWRIPAEAVKQFEERRSAKPVVKAPRQRRSQEVPSYV
jgi:hypothetical protein